MKKIILASQSPRRRELLKLINVEFDVMPSLCDELVSDTDPGEIVIKLSHDKASDVAKRVSEREVIVVGADTIVVYDGEILGKPKSSDEAFNMLKKLSGNVHQVYTGVTIIDICQGIIRSFYDVTDVEMFKISDSDINAYIKTGDPFDKAGGYGIQSKGAFLVKGIKGDFYNVVGLPVARLYQELLSL